MSIDEKMFDSRDVATRISELENMDRDEWDETELGELRQLRDDCSDYPPTSWADGLTFIADYYFEEFARSFAEDIGAIEEDGRWPADFIDWVGASDALKSDFTSVEFQGTTYWIKP